MDPAKRLPQPKLPRLLPRPIDLRKALDNAPDARMRAFLALAAYAGLRCTEIAGLSRHDVLDRADPPVLIAHGKRNKDRVVPMCQTVIDALLAHGMPSRGPIFGRLDGKPGATSAHRVTTVMSEYLAELEIDGRMHTLAPPIRDRDVPAQSGHPGGAGVARLTRVRRPQRGTRPTPGREPSTRSRCSTRPDPQTRGRSGSARAHSTRRAFPAGTPDRRRRPGRGGWLG